MAALCSADYSNIHDGGGGAAKFVVVRTVFRQIFGPTIESCDWLDTKASKIGLVIAI